MSPDKDTKSSGNKAETKAFTRAPKRVIELPDVEVRREFDELIGMARSRTLPAGERERFYIVVAEQAMRATGHSLRDVYEKPISVGTLGAPAEAGGA